LRVFQPLRICLLNLYARRPVGVLGRSDRVLRAFAVYGVAAALGL